ncbi:MAG: sugar ABC transporter permease [Armatimonadota bacterium]|nr:sugar ABC transporter permease [Armatimonadota bacterium]MDR7451041.1 sugar ABC transporter permease [Armatimonadota bacterium]MDR7465938.1 sugar ABC transporter permease [Armatimonadota bacterium]MDR7494003.1 sugar ABC transporter permease [Armatimonadota bacterium]MDR7498453.1 sugar ABC transporter permease [Armatimonadota bacterium]
MGYLFVAPALLLLLAVLAYPALRSLRLSLSAGRGSSGYTLVQYADLLRSDVFRQVLANTAIFVVASVALHLLLGLAVALALNRPLFGRTAFRVMALLPWVVPDVVAGIVWKWILNPLYGLMNDLLFRAGLIAAPVEWLTSPRLVLPAVVLANVWRGFPFVMIILLAGLQSIPIELYEAAAIDGAGTLQRFRHVTLPGLRKVLIVALALDTIWEVRRFGLIQAMTAGGPGIMSEVLSTQVFKQYFQFFRFEYASAMAIAMTGLLLLVSLPYVRMIVRQE